ncbi:MAG: hypothetical protein ABR915_18570 [Thermoguttaceae bacterium]
MSSIMSGPFTGLLVNLEWVTLYIRNQGEHHSKGTIHDRLERIAELEG